MVQTFSKSRAMAGERIGFAIGSVELIKALHDVKYSFNSYTMNRSALDAGTAAVQNAAYLQEITARIVKTREHTKQVLAEMGFQFPDSKSNFLFVTHPDCDAHELFEALREAHILSAGLILPESGTICGSRSAPMLKWNRCSHSCGRI